MSGGNQKAIIAREVDKEPDLLVAVQPTRGLDVGAIEYIHKQIVAERDKGKAVLLVSLELDEVMNLSDRILVIYEGEIVGEFDRPRPRRLRNWACIWQALKARGGESMSKKSKQPLLQNPGVVGVLASLLSIVIGLVLGFMLLVVLNPGASVEGHEGHDDHRLCQHGQAGQVLYQAAPLMMCGLSVGFAFKTGLFNIGAPGQYTMGSFFALLCAIQFQLPWFVCLLAGAIGGAIWGIFPGLFKAYFNVNEVITSIMFNWIGMYLVNLILGQLAQDAGFRLGALPTRTVPRLCLPPTPAPSCPRARSPGCSVIPAGSTSASS